MSDAIAKLFYGDNAPASAPAREPTPGEKSAEAFYGNDQTADAPAGGDLYDVATYLRGRLDASRAPLADALGLTREQLETEEREFVQTVRELDLEWGLAGAGP
jgi:hypothetical protein